MNRTEIENEVNEKFISINEFLNGDFVDMHEYMVTDEEFKRHALRLYRLATELKLATDELEV